MLLLCEVVDGAVEEGVVVACGVVGGLVHVDVWRRAEFGEFAFGVGDRACRESHVPPVGQLAGEGQSAAAANAPNFFDMQRPP